MSQQVSDESNTSAAAAAAVELCQEYLARMEARQLDAAATMLAPGAGIVFPGGAVRTSVHEIAAGSARRYSRIGKHITHWDVCAGAAPGEFVVYSIGTLHGAWADSTPFQGIRYIDRFVVKGGLIVRQDVWNDAAEVKGASPG